MRKRRIYLLLGMMCAAAGFMAACGSPKKAAADRETPEFVFTYAENQAEDYPTTQGAYCFAELVREKTDGRIEIQINADGVLGDERNVVEQMQFGGIDFARVSLTTMGDTIPKLNVLQLPYLYTGAEHMWKVLEGEIGDDFLASVSELDLVALSWYDAGARNFYSTTKPIRTLEDMKGMNIRVQESELMLEMVRALGAYPTASVYSEVYSELQTGAIDGAENNWPSYESANHYEVAKYFTLDEHTRVPELQIVAGSTWKKLSEEDQVIIRECAQESARYERKLWADREKTSEDKVRAAGCEVIELSPEEKTKFRDAVIPMYGKFCADYVDIIDKIVAVGK